MKIAYCGASILGTLSLLGITPAYAQDSVAADPATHSVAPQTAKGPKSFPTAPDDPYPIEAAGWGSGGSNGLFTERWIEDWSRLRAAGKAPPLKAMPIVDGVTLTLNGELRLGGVTYDNGYLVKGNDYSQFRLRARLGADLRFGDHFRVYGELGHGTVSGHGNPTVEFQGKSDSASYHNDLSLQQAFAEIRGYVGKALIGVQGGRMEYSDAPNLIIGLSDSGNIHRTWNGYRGYLHTDRFRIGVFTAHPTTTGFGYFDEVSNSGERLDSVIGSVVVAKSKGTGIYFDPMFYHRHTIKGTSGSSSGLDTRDTWGARFWGKTGPWAFSYLAVRQTGEHVGRRVSAWMASANQSYGFGDIPLKPRIGLRIDAASGGDTYAKPGQSYANSGTIHGYDILYQSSSYISQGGMLVDTNLLLISPTLSIAPVKNVTVAGEYDFARRMRQNDAVYGKGTRAYAGTQNVPGHDIGKFARLIVAWNITRNVTLDGRLEHLFAGNVLKRAGFGSGNYALSSITLRY